MNDARRTWDENKNRSNLRKRGLSFETAALVFADPLMLQRTDPHSEEERWLTVGLVGNVVVVVSHTSPDLETGAEAGMGGIISARKATSQERRAYEEEEF